LLVVVFVFAMGGAAAFATVSNGTSRWRLGAVVTIGIFSVLSDLTGGFMVRRVTISGSFLGIILAAVILGGGPAALLGVMTICIGWFRSRENLSTFCNNLVNYAWFPLVAGLTFHALTTATHVPESAAAFYLLVFVAFVLGLLLNFAIAAGWACYVERASFSRKVAEVLIPILPAELFSALLTLGAVYIYVHLATVGLMLCALVFIIYQYLVGELLVSKRRGDALQRAATTDDLTGLANRERFRTAVEERIAKASEAETTFPVLLMDLDRFKEINDTLGHHYGDVLLRDLGPRLVAAVGEKGLVARLGGDEFGILLGEDIEDVAVLEVFLTRLVRIVSEPFSVDELSLEVGASIGVARFPADGEDAHALLRCADIAMYTAKETQTDYKVYTAEQNQHSVRRLSVLSDIRHALASDEIVVHYQPIIDLDDLRVRGAEGLVRWQHPEHGLIPPGAFVTTIEQTGLIGPLTRHVLERSIAECAAWRRDGRELSVAVNLSVRNLLDRDLPLELDRLLDVYALPPEALQLEITESMIMSDPERALATVGRLSALGVRLSVDDFGTGYSSLANLRKMPIDELKIDRSFVSPMLQDESDLIIVRSTINLGHDLGLRVIAEGVEDGATLDELAALGCDLAQGYHVSRPMPADAFNAWLARPLIEDPPAVAAASATPAATSPVATAASAPAAAAPAPANGAGGAIDLSLPTFAAPES
jgi:diguanylate cyclase (GGDEF)-like protein